MRWRLVVALTASAATALMTGTPIAYSAPSADPAEPGTGVSPAIIGGKPGSEVYRFHASLQWRDQGTRPSAHRCGGTLIASKWVVTAAHCVASTATGVMLDPKLFKIVLGSNDYQVGQVHSIAKFERHPEWFNGKDWGHDIGLIELETPSRQTPIRSILHPPGDELLRMIGWGRTVDGDPASIPRQVQEVDGKLLLWVDCKFGDEFDITPGEVCVELPNDGNSGPCAGDSGSPLLWKVDGVWRIVGVTSRSGGTGCLKTPTVYTTTDDNMDWINKEINAKS